MEKAPLLASVCLVAILAACAAPGVCGRQNCDEDLKLSSLVKKQLDSHPALVTDLLSVQTTDRIVYLNGAADSWLEYYEAEEIARAVPGVLKVINKIEVKSPYG